MKKGFLFGLGVLIAGVTLAATISTVSITNKTPGDTVTNEEFNSITTGLESLTDTFNATTSDATSITLAKTLSAPEICIESDCKTAWPTGGGTADNLGNHIATQDIVPSVNNSFALGSDTSKFSNVYSQSICLNSDCRTTWPTGGGADLTSVDTDILPEMTGATALMGNPPGSPEVVSVRNIGSATKWFKEIWVEDLHLGNQSLYMNGVKILESDPAVEMRFSADDGQDMTLSTVGSDAVLRLESHDDLEMTVPLAGTSKLDANIMLKNETVQGKITLQSKATGLGANPMILLDSPKVGVNTAAPAYTLDVTGDINFTGDLYQNGVAFSGGGSGTTVNTKTCTGTDKISAFNATTGTFTCSTDETGGGGTSPWTVESGQISYADGLVGIGVANPVTSLDVSGGKILAEEFCINTPSTPDVCASKSCSGSLESGETGSTCFTQATLTALESKLSEPSTSYWSSALGDNIYRTDGSVGIGTNNPRSRLTVAGDVTIESNMASGDYGDLDVEGSIQVGGSMCPAPGASCTRAGEIASCGAGGAILACSGVGSEWLPITSHNGTTVGTTAESCTSAIAGKMRFLNGTSQSLQICMKLEGSSTYDWRTIMSGGGMAQF